MWHVWINPGSWYTNGNVHWKLSCQSSFDRLYSAIEQAIQIKQSENNTMWIVYRNSVQSQCTNTTLFGNFKKSKIRPLWLQGGTTFESKWTSKNRQIFCRDEEPIQERRVRKNATSPIEKVTNSMKAWPLETYILLVKRKTNLKKEEMQNKTPPLFFRYGNHL